MRRWEKLIQDWMVLRAIRKLQNPPEWSFEPTTLRQRIRQATCLLTSHRFTEGISEEEDEFGDEHVLEVGHCSRCGLFRYGACLTHGLVEVEED